MMLLAKRQCIHGPKFGMITPAAFADVVEQSGQIQELNFWTLVDQTVGDGELLHVIPMAELTHLLDHF
jgi:hypothetical protein